MYKYIKFYIISSLNLKLRKKYMSGAIEALKKITEENGNLSTSINIINEPSDKYIENNIENYNKRVNIEKENDEEFNNLIQKINIQQISNIEKHRNIYLEISKDNSNDTLHYILEDDILVSNDYINNIKDLFKNINNFNNWDILFTCISNNDENSDIKLLNLKDHYKILISKSSYFLNPKIALKLYNFLNDIKFTLKIALSKFIIVNNINAKILNKHTLLEGSKIGIFLSSLNNNNFLYQNNDYVKITNMLNVPVITKEIADEAEKIYKNNQLNINNADFQHLLGIMFYKIGDYNQSKKYLIDAVLNIKKNEGLLNNHSEILNNCINMHQYDQPDLEDCFVKPSKY